MNLHPDDPRLTTYILDELAESERKEVSRAVAADARLVAEADALRRTAERLQRALTEADTAALSPEARRAILRAAPLPGAAPLPSLASNSRSASSHRPKPASLFISLRRTFRRVACFAVLVGAAYLVGLAAWTDTRPRAAIVLVGSRSSDVWAGSDFAMVARRGAADSSYSTTDSLDSPGDADADADDGVFADGTQLASGTSEVSGASRAQWLLARGGEVTFRRFTSPSSMQTQAESQAAFAHFPSISYTIPLEARDYDASIGLAAPQSPGLAAPQNTTMAGVRAMPRDHPAVVRANYSGIAGGYACNIGDGRIEDSLYFREHYARLTAGGRFDFLDARFAAVQHGFFGIDPAQLLTDLNSSETYTPVTDNPFLLAAAQPVSTFSIDVDTASYSNIRRHLLAGQLPPKDAVRIEEMINAFHYDYPAPDDDRPFSITAEVGECPWTPQHRLVRIGLQGYHVDPKDRPPVNLVFLVDVSGSMQDSNKLPLVRDSLKVLLEQLWADDRVGIVTYAGESRVALPSTPGSRYDQILAAVDSLAAEGSTNGGAGIRDAYALASDNFIEGGVNRVMLCTDGDFNVGVTDDNELVQLIRDEAASGVFLSVLGFGTGNLKDGKLEALADKGNGHYAYIDDLVEARRVLGDEAGATLQTIARDVKIQVEFNPAQVQAYRLIGYENRLMAARDFADDAKDAGEIGAGHSVTALYEVVPVGVEFVAADASVSDAAESSLDADAGEGAEDDPQAGDGQWSADAATAADVDHAAAEAVDADNAVGPADGDGPEGAVAQTGEGDAELAEAGPTASQDALLTLRLRYKAPDGDVSELIELPVEDAGAVMEEASGDFLFTAAVASFGMLLRHSPHVGDWTLEACEELAGAGIGEDIGGYRGEFIELVRKAIDLRDRQPAPTEQR